MEPLSESTRLLYVQLLTQCLGGSAPSGRGLSFVTKQIKGAKHWYLQVTIGDRKTQHYLGPDNEGLRSLVDSESALWERVRPDYRERERLVSMLVSGGAHTVTATEARVFELLERAGVFLAGGVLVGSHAFGVYGNMLGVHWGMETTRTHDVDIAGDRHMLIGIEDRAISLKDALIESDLGFIEIPALDRKAPSTRFRMRGQQLSVDLLTPMKGKPHSAPIYIEALNTFAEPIRFLDYLLEDAQPAVVVARGGILVNVPSPARYALHKLVIAERRIPAFHAKTGKDIQQAEQLIQVLADTRPGDIRLALDAALKFPVRFREQMEHGARRLAKPVQQLLKAASK